MTEIDERIVAMQFDNKNFEKHAKETIKTLEKLRENLDMDEAVDSLNDLTKVSKDLNLEKAAESAEKLHRAFTGVQKIASKTFSVATFPIGKLGRALGGLASDVKKWFGIDLARTLEQSATKAIRALTVEPISAGWDEYEMKMDSIKTIMAGTKKEFASLSDDEHLGKVKDVLEQLNHYADETIYSFKDMTSNIGKFTNAGVKLDIAAKSMMGISNLAAQAGQGAQQASMAMYNFSQAMSLGYVELRDWRSIENANMATMEFKETLIDVGLQLGTLKKDSKGTVKTAVKGQKQVEVTAEKVRDTLNKRWLTNDVLQTTLEIYSGELSREEIKRLGKFTDEQIDHFMELGAAAKRSATEVRTFSKMFDALKESAQSGWAMSFEYIIGDLNEAKELWTNLNKRISGWLDASAENRNKILQEWRGNKTDETGRVWKNSTDHDGRQDLIDSLNSILNIMEKIGGAVSKVMEDVFGKLTGEKLAAFTGKIAAGLKSIDEWLGDIGEKDSRISKISRALKIVLAPIKLIIKVAKQVGSIIKTMIMPFVDPVLTFLATLGDLILDLVDGNIGLDKFFDDVGKSIRDGWSKIKNLLFGNKAFDFTKGRAVYNHPVANFFAGIGETISTWVGKIVDGSAFTELGEWLTKKWNEVQDLILGPLAKDEETGKMVRTGPVGRLFDNLSGMIAGEIEKFKKDPKVQGISKFLSGIFDPIKEFFVGKDIETSLGIKVHKLGGFEIMIQNIKKAFGLDGGKSDLTGTFTTWSGNISAAWEPIATWFGKANEDVSLFITNIGSWTGWDAIGTFFSNIWGAITKWWTDNKPNEGTWKSIKLWFGEVNTKVTSFTNKARRWSGWKVIGDFFSSVWSQISDWWINNKPDGDTWTNIKNWFTNVHNDVTEFITNVGTWAEDIGLGKYFQDYIITPIQTLFNFLFPKAAAEGVGAGEVWEGASAIGNISESIKKAWSEDKKSEIEGIKDDIASTCQSVVDEPNAVFGEKDTNGESMFSKVMTWFNNLSETISTTWNNVWTTLQTISNDIHSGVTTVREAFDEIVRWLVESPWDEWLTTFNAKLTETGKALGVFNTGLNIGGLFSFLGGVGKASKLIGKNGLKLNVNFGEQIGSFFSNIGEGGKSFLTSFGDSLKDGTFFKNIGKTVGSYKEGATTSIQRIQSFANVMIEFAGAVAAMVWAINQLIDKVKEISDIQDDAKKKEIWTNFQSIFVTILGSIGFTEIAAIIQGASAKQKVSMLGSLLGFAGAIEAMVLAINQLIGIISTTDEKKVDKAIGVLDHLVLLVTAFQALGNMSFGDASSGSSSFAAFGGGKKSGLIGFAIAIEAMILAMKQIIEATKNATEDQIDKAITVLLELTGLVTAFELLGSMQFGEHVKIGGGQKSGLIGFTIAIAELVSAVSKIAEITKDKDVDLAAVQTTIAELAGLITGFVAFKNLTSVQIGEGFKSGNKSSGLIGFTIAMASLVLEVQKLAQGDPQKLSRATTVLERLSTLVNTFVIEKNLGSLFSSEIVAGGFNYKGGSKSTGILGFIAAITALFIEVEIIASQDVDKIQKAEDVIQDLGDMILIFVGEKGLLSLLNTGLNKIPGNSSTASEAISLANLIAFVGAIGALLYGAAELSKMDEDQYKRCIGAVDMIKQLVTVLTQEQFIGALSNLMGAVATKLAGSVGPGQAAMAALNGVIAVTISLLGILVQAAMFGGLYRLLGGDEFISVLQDGTKVAGALGEFFSAFIGGITKSVVKGAEAGKAEADAETMVHLSEILGDLTDDDMDHLTTIVGKMKDLTEKLRGFDPTLFQTIFSGDITLGRFADYMIQLGGGLRSFSDSVGSGFSSSAVQTGIELLTLFAEFGILTKDTDYFAVDQLIGSLRLLGKQSEELRDLFGDKSVNWEGISGIFEGIGEAVGHGITNGIGQIGAQSIVDAIRDNLNSDKFSSESVQAMIEEWLFGNGQDDTLLGQVMQVGSDTIDQLTLTAEHAVDEAGNVAGDYASNVSDALIKAMEDVQNGGDYSEAFNNVWSIINDSSGLFGGLSDVGTEAAQKAVDDFSKGLTGTRKILYDAGANAGYYLDLGMASGILKNRSLPEDSASLVGLSTAQALRDSTKVESPSKVTEEIGMFLMKGLGIGITTNGYFAVDAIYAQGSAYADAMREALSPLDSVLSDQFNFNPTITPVLDMSNVREGLGGISGMFGNRYAMNMTVPSFTRNAQMPNIQTPQVNNAAAIASINERIEELNANISNLKIYLDTGVLVGSTVSMYDRALGARASRAKRG